MSTSSQKHKALRNVLSCAVIIEAINVIEDEHKLFAMNRMSKIRREAFKNRIYRQRQKWGAFLLKLSDRQFRRYFRMERECFILLCRKNEGIIRAHEFKNEENLAELNADFTKCTRKLNTLSAHSNLIGGFICDKIKLKTTRWWLLSGSSIIIRNMILLRIWDLPSRC